LVAEQAQQVELKELVALLEEAEQLVPTEMMERTVETEERDWVALQGLQIHLNKPVVVVVVARAMEVQQLQQLEQVERLQVDQLEQAAPLESLHMGVNQILNPFYLVVLAARQEAPEKMMEHFMRAELVAVAVAQ
jgi:hypothetical protein